MSIEKAIRNYYVVKNYGAKRKIRIKAFVRGLFGWTLQKIEHLSEEK